jgi:ankyrin repeat protein
MEGIKNMIDEQVEDLEKILGVHGKGVNELDSKRMAPLHYAAWYNKKNVVQALLDKGAGAICSTSLNVLCALYTCCSPLVRSFESAAIPLMDCLGI